MITKLILLEPLNVSHCQEVLQAKELTDFFATLADDFASRVAALDKNGDEIGSGLCCVVAPQVQVLLRVGKALQPMAVSCNILPRVNIRLIKVLVRVQWVTRLPEVSLGARSRFHFSEQPVMERTGAPLLHV